jgi:hypothetical protein
MRHAGSQFEAGSTGGGAVEILTTASAAGRGVALRLVCLVRAGDRYVVRAAGRPGGIGVAARSGRSAPGDAAALSGATAQLDISFGDAGDRRTAAALHLAVRHIQRWCELGTTVALLDTGTGVTLCGEDGTAVPLPGCAA